jgi:hypothetical protein
VGARSDGGRYLGEMECHAFGVAAWQQKACALAVGGADGTVNVGRRGPLVLGCRRSRAALGPSSGDTVLLADPGFVLSPEFYGRAVWEGRFDRCQLRWEIFLKTSMASAPWA